MPEYKVLVSNDDGRHSPLLVPFFDSLTRQSWCAQLRVAVPAEEQSWIAQAATRLKPLTAASHSFDRFSGYIIDGTPADCLSIGIDNLYPDRPDFAFCGINLGTNCGLAFFLSSGTVGGARQAFLCGIRSAAFSVKVPRELVDAWLSRDLDRLAQHSADWQRIADVCASIAASLIRADAWQFADFFSINIPWSAGSETKAVLTYLERRSYLPIYKTLPDGTFLHSFGGFREIEAVEAKTHLCGDISALEEGRISVTPVLHNLYPVDASRIEHLQKALG